MVFPTPFDQAHIQESKFWIKSFLSICTTKITMKFNETILSTGTAFFYSKNGHTYIVTNRHNLTGLHQETGKPLSPTAGIPNAISFSLPTIQDNGDIIKIGNSSELFELKWGDYKPWKQHPTYGDMADVVVIDPEKTPIGKISKNYCINTLDHQQPLALYPSAPVSILGYPYGKSVGDFTPIWVSGSIASEPELNVDGKPAMYVDCRTNKGSSGSPVIRIATGQSSPLDSAPIGNTLVYKSSSIDSEALYMFGTSVHRFVGIYSGRIDKESDIGLVWKEHVIEEICASFEKESPY